MKDSDRFKLYFGPYKTPRFKYGQKVWCEYRGWVKIVGLSDGKSSGRSAGQRRRILGVTR